MTLIKKILNYSSLSIVGMGKNTGKTECLNFLIRNLRNYNKKIGITSIGVDGEKSDVFTEMPKPEIEIFPGIIFVTSENHYKQKQITSEILDISERTTPLGRLVTAEAKDKGKIIFSGPSQTLWLKQIIEDNKKRGVNLFIVDGALSRKSSASPSITDCMILTTGAAISHDINLIVKKTSYQIRLINLESIDIPIKKELIEKKSGLFVINGKQEIIDTGISSGLIANTISKEYFKIADYFFVSGILTDKFLETLRVQNSKIKIIVRDFTKIFVSREKFNAFIKNGGQIKVLHKAELIGVCINPVSPNGFKISSDELKEKLENEINLPVYDIKNIKSENI